MFNGKHGKEVVHLSLEHKTNGVAWSKARNATVGQEIGRKGERGKTGGMLSFIYILVLFLQ